MDLSWISFLVTFAYDLLLQQPARVFYGLQALALFSLWLGVRLGDGTDYHRFPLGNDVALKPSWLPTPLFVWLLRRPVYMFFARSVIPALVLAAVWPQVRVVRALPAVAFALCHVAECSRTSSHWGYLVLYNFWALALLPDKYAQAMSLGFVVHYMTATGIAKLLIGGAGWADLRAVLTTFGAKPFKQGGPMVASLNHYVVNHGWAAKSLGTATLLLECVLAPLALVVPLPWRFIVVIIMILFHAGIAVLQSAAIGIFFVFPNTMCYVFGLAADFAVGSAPWCVAISTWMVLTVPVLLRRRLLPEDWPLTPLALFPWSSRQWELLHRHFTHGSTRLVLTTDDDESLPNPKDMQIVELTMSTARGSMTPEGRKCSEVRDGCRAYDAWSRIIGITTFQQVFLDHLDFEAMENTFWDPAPLVCNVQAWLQYGRLVELKSSKPLVRAFFVALDEKAGPIADEATAPVEPRVAKIICHGPLEPNLPNMPGLQAHLLGS